MDLSLNWLKRYIDFDLTVDELSEVLTDIGLEVEGITKVESIKGGLQGVVVGHVLECGQHPNADKLSLTKVNIGELEPKQIVCGAPNVAAGQKVLVATIGTVLYDKEGESFKIKKGKIRGEVSEGMICAEDELGLGQDHSGIMVLPDEVPVGTRARDYFKIEDDYVYDIGLTPNRSDATCHLGAAKDLAAYLRINKEWTSSIKDPDLVDFHVEGDITPYKVTIENEKGCPRYSGILLHDIEVKESPQWMQNLLSSVGVRPINNIVDITNFVLHEYGQPLHAFDADKVEGNELRIKNLPSGTKFISLDEKERTLTDADLMICDGNDTPMCIAGVFGGLNSGVTDTTTTIFLESAHFSASSLRQTSTRHLLRTDAAKIFEKGSDPNVTVTALKRAALLMKEYAGATISSPIVDEYPQKINPVEIAISYEKINTIVGTQLSQEKVHDILRAMEMEIKPVYDNGIIVKVPTNKADVTRDVDIIEEILRIYGFNEVPIPKQLRTAINYSDYPSKRQIQNGIADLLCHNGFNEMMGLSLIESEKFYEVNGDHVLINNTSNIHLNLMRPDALLSGLKSVAHNHNHQQLDLKLFEFGRFYKKIEEGFVETDFLSLFITGKTSGTNWNEQSGQTDFYSIKKWVGAIVSRIGLQKFQTSTIEDDRFNEGLVYHRGPKHLVKFGAISKGVLKKMDISSPVYYAEFDTKELYGIARKSRTTFKEISKFPSTSRDLSLVLREQVKFDEIKAITHKTEKKLIQEVSLFDVYRNEEHLGAGKKAYAVKFVFQDATKTLKDKDIDKVVNKLVHNFKEKLGAELRS